MSTIQKRLNEVLPQDIQKMIYKMANDSIVLTEGAKKNKMYFVSSKKK